MDPEFVALLRRYLKFAATTGIEPDSSLRDLGLDSMRSIELLFAVEDSYGVVIPDDRLTDATFATAGSLWALIQELDSTAVTTGP